MINITDIPNVGGCGKAALVIVPDRTTKTIEQWLKDYVAPGSVIYHDGWKAYQSINWDKFQMIPVETIHYPKGSENQVGNFTKSYLIEGVSEFPFLMLSA